MPARVRIVQGIKMTKKIVLTVNDPILDRLNFKSYQSTVERRFERFSPGPGEPKREEIPTPWGESLTAKAGDYLVSEMDSPDDRWPVDPEIFEKSYEIIRPGICMKKAVTKLVPLVDVTDGDADQMVTVYTLEGPETVRAGDFYLARGVHDEIWTYPKEKVQNVLKPAE
jgi:hypothetical protein